MFWSQHQFLKKELMSLNAIWSLDLTGFKNSVPTSSLKARQRNFSQIIRKKASFPNITKASLSSQIRKGKKISIQGKVSTVSQERFKQKVITQANDYHRVKGDILKVQNCHECTMCWHKDIAKIQILLKIILNQPFGIQYERRVVDFQKFCTFNRNLIDSIKALLSKISILCYFYVMKIQ